MLRPHARRVRIANITSPRHALNALLGGVRERTLKLLFEVLDVLLSTLIECVDVVVELLSRLNATSGAGTVAATTTVARSTRSLRNMIGTRHSILLK